MVDRLSCPESTRLPELFANPGAREPADLVAHLAGCTWCQDALARLAVGGAGWLQTPMPEWLSRADPPDALRQVMEGLKMAPPGAAGGPAAAPDLGFLGPTDHPGAIGSLGPYPILKVIGRGGMGVVFTAFDAPLNRVVAVKVLAPELAASGTARQRFLREARAAAAVVHEHVVGIHAVDQANGLPYLVMEYVRGLSLQEKIDRDGPLDPTEAVRIALQTASGLAAAHAQGLIHRDIKPANILLENGVQRVKITDFGLARGIDDAGCTHPGTIAGTPQYMAPEQAGGGPALDTRADLFSLGAVLFTAATGRPPFQAPTSLGVMHQVATADPPSMRALNPAVPSVLEATTRKLLAKNPADRFQSAAAVVEELQRVLVRMQLPEADPPAREGRPRRLFQWAAVAAAVALVMTALAVAPWWGRAEGTLAVAAPAPGTTLTIDGPGGTIVVPADGADVRLPVGTYRVTATRGGEAATDTVVVERDVRREVAVPALPIPPWTVPRMPAPSPPVIGEFDGHTGPVRGLVVHPSGTRFASATGWPVGDGTIRVWDLKTQTEVHRIVISPAAPFLQIDALARTPDGEHIVAGLSDGSVQVYGWAATKASLEFKAHGSNVTTVAVSPDGTTVASAAIDGTVRVSDLATGREVWGHKSHANQCRAVAFSPNGELLASGGLDQVIYLWDARSGTPRGKIPADGDKDCGPVWAVAFADDQMVVAGGDRGAVGYDVGTGERRREFGGPKRGMTALAVSPDGTALAGGNHDGTAWVWDVRTGQARNTLDGEVGILWAVAFTPKGDRILTGGGGFYMGSVCFPGTEFTIRSWAVSRN